MAKIKKDTICCIEGCENKVYTKRLCSKHYLQIYKYGKIKNRTIFDPNEIIVYEDYAEIVLYNKNCEEVAKTKIDLEDVERCKEYKWRLIQNNYVVSDTLNKKVLLLHRYITNAKDNEIVDHINRNPLDNRKSVNLRICNETENNRNKNIQNNNTSGIIGVSQIKITNKWRARINVNKKEIFLGNYENKEDAIVARLKAELKYFGKDFAPQRHLFEQYGIE